MFAMEILQHTYYICKDFFNKIFPLARFLFPPAKFSLHSEITTTATSGTISDLMRCG